MHKPLFSLHYLPCTNYFSELIKHKEIYIEAHENFVKQTYRNRCKILAANGVLPLIIPIQHNADKLITSIKTQNDTRWQAQHWQSIKSAYGSSPFFLYYKDIFEVIYFDTTFTSLFDFNLALLKLTLSLLKVDVKIYTTNLYNKTYEHDFRNIFDAKKSLTNNTDNKPYYQVFDNKFPFQKNLSIIDLLFSQGTYSLAYL